MSAPIDVETVPESAPLQTMALERRQDQAVGRALSPKELHERLEFIRQVMRDEMKEGTDYGKIPGCGDKPSLLQPGAQKLLMTFNLRAQVQKETLRELPHPQIFGHREYEFTVRVFPNGADPAREGTDGVGTCSTFESKYRYRKSERKCPKCGNTTIIVGKEEYGGGFLCWKKKGGCGEKFSADNPLITQQNADDVENEDPADAWNTCRKMAFKRALVASVINFTNTSELWTQDLEDMAGNANARGSAKSAGTATAARAAAQQRSAQTQPATTQTAKPTTTTTTKPPAEPKYANEKTRAWLIQQLKNQPHAVEYFRKVCNPAVLLPNEALDELPLWVLPVTMAQLGELKKKIQAFSDGAEAAHAYPPNPVKDPKDGPKERKAPASQPTGQKSNWQETVAGLRKNPEWFWDIVIPVPRKGMKKADYDKAPDTIGALYDAMKDNNDQDAQHRLWGLVKNWDAQPRQYNGKTYQPSNADHICRAALDDFADWHDKREQSELPIDVPF